MEPGQALAAAEAPQQLRLLLVDDDPVLLNSLRDTLEIDGHIVVATNGGQAGIIEFRASLERGAPYAAVITDLGMPNVDGRRVAAAVKEAAPATPVILLTGWGQRLIAEGDIPAHVDRVLAAVGGEAQRGAGREAAAHRDLDDAGQRRQAGGGGAAGANGDVALDARLAGEALEEQA